MRVLKKLLGFMKSLRFRITLVIFACIVLPACICVTVFLNNYESRQVNSLAVSLTSQAQLISSQIVAGGYLSESSSLDSRLRSLKEMFTGRIMIMDASMNILIDTYDIYEGRVLIWEKALRSASGETITDYDSVNHLISVSIPIGTSEDIAAGDTKGVVMISRNTDNLSRDVELYKRLGFIIIVSALAAGLFVSFFASLLLLMPMHTLARNVKELRDDTRMELGMTSASDINAISRDINTYADKHKNMDSSMKDFLSNVSHELKTPLTSMKIMADSLNASEDTPVEFYREFMVDIASEIDRETAIINDLIGLVKNEEYVSTLNPEPVNVNDIMESVLKTLSPLAEKAGVDLLLETFRPIVMEIDTVKFSQAMINLIENAIKYNKKDGYVHVSVNSDANNCYIRIEDNGIGIPKESLDQIFERFYRVDTSHSKEIEGTGLGLSIVKSIITLHQGQIKADSIEGQGTTFTVKLPLVLES